MYLCTLKFRRGLVNLITVKYVKWILPVVFILYYSSIALFTHVHVENGITIVHSHPFKKAADGSPHQHASLSEIQLYHVLSSVNVADGAVHSLQLHFYAIPYFNITENPVYPTYLAPVLGELSLRAPPFLS
ncbi:MAG: hypothetical protein IJD84_04735 [Parabacteroides sp.]|nr:hypothetical protein [Parabacteroides sp.]